MNVEVDVFSAVVGFVSVNKPTTAENKSGARQTVVAASGFRMNVEVDVFSAVVGLLVLTNRPRLRTHQEPVKLSLQPLVSV